MELKQIYTKSVNPLVQKSFACQWSEDDRISVITEKGVHIFEVMFSPTQANPILNLNRSFINSPETLPGELYKDQIIDNIIAWEKDDVYSFFMNQSYLPIYPRASQMIPEVKNLCWSPQNLLMPQKCMIALLTSSGAVEIVLQIDRDWITAFEFTDVWFKVVNEDSESQKICKEFDSQYFRQKLDRLLMTAVTWSLLYQNNNKSFAYLTTGHRNSEIVVWKVYGISSDTLNHDVNLNVELKFKKKLIDQNVAIVSLLWIEMSERNYYLIIGYHNGQIGVLQLEEIEGELTFQLYNTFYSDVDKIPVSSLDILKINNNSVEVSVVKGMYLLIIILGCDGTMINMSFISSPGFSITGISVFNSNQILITTQDTKFCMIENGDDHDLKCTELKIDTVKNNVQCLGLANSMNRMLYTFISSPSIVYDHLILREPSDVTFFSIFNEAKLDPIDVLNEKKSLLNTWDCLELIKIYILKYNQLPNILSKISLNIESLPLHKLRIAYWVMIISQTLKNKKNSFNVSNYHKDIEKSRSHLFLHSAIRQLNYLSLQGSLTEVQKLSMSLLRNHLDIWLAGEEEEAETSLSAMAKQSLETTSKFQLIEQEKCNLCNSIIVEPWASTCPEGHQLPRCAITCLQVTCMKFRRCNICQEIFHPSLDEEMKIVKCPYCDKPALYHNRILDPIFLESKKNLSKKRATTKESKQIDEKEEGEENKTAKE